MILLREMAFISSSQSNISQLGHAPRMKSSVMIYCRGYKMKFICVLSSLQDVEMIAAFSIGGLILIRGTLYSYKMGSSYQMGPAELLIWILNVCHILRCSFNKNE